MTIETNPPTGTSPDVPDEGRHAEIADGAPTSERLARVAKCVLVGIAVYSFIQAGFSIQLGRLLGLQLLPVTVGILLLGGIWLAPARRLLLAAVALAGLGLVLAVEIGLNLLYGTPAPADGDIDRRSRWEFVQDMRREGMDLYGLDLPLTALGELEWPDGSTLTPLSSVANRRSALCNESGAFVVDYSDEMGFRNPQGLWDRDTVAIMTIGDSFTEGACVPMDSTIHGHLRRRFPATINIGRGGFSPLGELAALVEYAQPVKPRIVIWFYHDNDLIDLNRDKTSTAMMRYVDEGFQQALYERREEVNQILTDRIAQLEATVTSESWPAGLRALGLTRSRAPLWLQDLVDGTDNTRLIKIVRLDRVNQRVRALHWYATAEPNDYVLFRDVVRRARDLTESWGGRFYFAYVPSWAVLTFPVHHDHEVQERVFEIVEDLGIPIIDPRPAMVDGDVDRLFFYPHSHYNSRGYAVVAQRVLAFLEAEVDAGRVGSRTTQESGAASR